MRRTALLAVTPLAAIAIAACGGSTTTHSTPASNAAPSQPATTSSQPAATSGASGSTSPASTSHATTTVTVGSTQLGKIVVDGRGRTLYEFAADKSGMSACSGACATVWPPLTTTGTPKAGSALKASLLSTIKRSDGTMQVTYAGHPLYYYEGDGQAGQTTGQALNQFGALWYVLNPAGAVITRG